MNQLFDIYAILKMADNKQVNCLMKRILSDIQFINYAFHYS